MLQWEYETEREAMLMVDRLLRADTAGQWREQDSRASRASGGGSSTRSGTPAQTCPE